MKTPKQNTLKNMKNENGKVVTDTILTHSCESWTTNEIQRSKMNSTEMRFLRRIKNKTRLDRIRNEEYSDELKV